MITKTLITELPHDLYEVLIAPHPNQTFDFTIPSRGAFNITTRSFVDNSVYFTIKVNNELLCINVIGRLGVNLVYAPILTLDNLQHGFFLYSSDSSVDEVTYQLLGNKIKLYYTPLPYQ